MSEATSDIEFEPVGLEHVGDVVEQANEALRELSELVLDLERGEAGTITIKLQVKRTAGQRVVLVHGSVDVKQPAKKSYSTVVNVLENGGPSVQKALQEVFEFQSEPVTRIEDHKKGNP